MALRTCTRVFSNITAFKIQKITLNSVLSNHAEQNHFKVCSNSAFCEFFVEKILGCLRQRHRFMDISEYFARAQIKRKLSKNRVIGRTEQFLFVFGEHTLKFCIDRCIGALDANVRRDT